jgi:hypothetical protein
MIAKTTARTTLIIAMLSLVGLTLPAGVTQTVFAQTVADGALSGTPLEGFFGGDAEQELEQEQDPELEQEQDPELKQDQRQDPEQEQELEQDQDQQQDQGQQQDQESSQDDTSTQSANVGAGDNTGTIAQDVDGNTIEGADCGDALICFGNDLVTDADMGQDSRVHDTNVDNTARLGDDSSEQIGVQNEDQDQRQDQRQDPEQEQELEQEQEQELEQEQEQELEQELRALNLDFEFAEQCFADAIGAADAEAAVTPTSSAAAAASGPAEVLQDCLFGESSQTNEEPPGSSN